MGIIAIGWPACGEADELFPGIRIASVTTPILPVGDFRIRANFMPEIIKDLFGGLSTDLVAVAVALLGLIFTGVFGALQLRRAFPNRAILRTELEILNLLDSDKYPEEYLKVQESINSRLHSIYLPESPKTLGVFGLLTILLYAGIFSPSESRLTFYPGMISIGG